MCDAAIDLFALLAFWSPGPGEMMVLAAVALLLYGGKLPEVARSWGKSFAEFRRGLSGIQNDINDAIYSEPQRLEYQPERTSYSDDSLPDPTEVSTTEPAASESNDENSEGGTSESDTLSDADPSADKRV